MPIVKGRHDAVTKVFQDPYSGNYEGKQIVKCEALPLSTSCKGIRANPNDFTK